MNNQRSNKALENLSKSVDVRVSRDQRVDEDVLSAFMDVLAERMTKGVEESTPAFDRLKQNLATIYAYDRFEEMDVGTAFSIGACWGVAELFTAWETMLHQTSESERLCKVVLNNRKMLLAMQKQPGISHKDLASAIGRSPSRLTQIVSAIEHEGLFVSSVVGRCKQYYLSLLGEKTIHQVIENEKSPFISNVNDNAVKEGSYGAFRKEPKRVSAYPNQRNRVDKRESDLSKESKLNAPARNRAKDLLYAKA